MHDDSESELRLARRIWGQVTRQMERALKQLIHTHSLSVSLGDLIYLDERWYVTHSGLLGISRRMKCMGIDTRPIRAFCDPSLSRWAFKATVYKSRTCRGFVGYGDADPSNVSFLVQGAEMRVAETRAVNRALRKAYGIGICSVEEIGSLDRQSAPTSDQKKLPKNVNGNGHHNRTVRDHLCQIIREHRLDPNLVKAYATDFCAVKTLRDATREQVENFVKHLADWAQKDRDAVLCQLNSYMRTEGGAA